MGAVSVDNAELRLLEDVVRWAVKDYLAGPQCCKAYHRQPAERAGEWMEAFASAREFLELADLLPVVHRVHGVPAWTGDIYLQQELGL